MSGGRELDKRQREQEERRTRKTREKDATRTRYEMDPGEWRRSHAEWYINREEQWKAFYSRYAGARPKPALTYAQYKERQREEERKKVHKEA